MKEFWDERYASQEYIFGKLPNEYLKKQLSRIEPGKILFPAEGEGRNAVHAALQGWEVHAFDQSIEGKRKALKLAEERGVRIDYRIGAMEEVDYGTGQFDAVVFIYAHFPPENKSAYHKRLAGFLRPGGTVIIETFSKLHAEYQKVNPNAGGPRTMGLLDSAEELRSIYDGFEILELTETETELSEGPFHRGKAHVVRFTGRKTAGRT